MDKKIKIIVNPVSGRGTGRKLIPEIDFLLKSHNLNFDLVMTEQPWHAAEIAEDAVQDGFEVVVAAGGDGTANEVLNGLMRAKKTGTKKAAMGFLSIGNGNDFAFGVEVPHDLKSACELLARNHRKLIDVGFVQGGLFPEGRYFGNGVGIGFDAVVGFEACKLKYLHGFLSYIVAALKTIFLYDNGPRLQIEFNEEKLVQPTLMVSIMNGKRMGGGFMMAPAGELNDGKLNICIARQVSRLKIFSLIFRFMKGTQNSHSAISIALTKRINVTALDDRNLPAHADGETLCTEGKTLTAELLPSQLEVIC